MKNNKAIKIAVGLLSSAAIIAAGWYGIDRVYIEKLPLFPLNLNKARERKANNSLGTVESKLEKLMAENKIHGFGVMGDLKTKKNYIGILTEKITDDLKSQIPNSINGVEVRWSEEKKASPQ